MAPVYRIGRRWPEKARIDQIGPRQFRLLDDVVLEVPDGVLDGTEGSKVEGLSVVMCNLIRSDENGIPWDRRVPVIYAHAGWRFDGPSFPGFIRPLIPDVAEHGAEGPAARHDALYRLAKLGLIQMKHRPAIDRAWRLDCKAARGVADGPARTGLARLWHRGRPWRFWLGVRLGGRLAFKPQTLLKGRTAV